MQLRTFSFLLAALFLCVIANSRPLLPYNPPEGKTDTITKGRYTLIFQDKSPDLDPAVRQKMIDAFFQVYPAQARKYNKKTRRDVVFIIDPAYDGVAATSGGTVRYNPQWFKKNPEDIDVVTHETMHIVQAYGGRSGPGWITEGIADYVRYKFGINNTAANWKLPEYSAKQNFQNSYRVTARFFLWIEKNYDPKFVQKLDKAMREKTYTQDFARIRTGKSFEELWSAYAQNPAL